MTSFPHATHACMSKISICPRAGDYGPGRLDYNASCSSSIKWAAFTVGRRRSTNINATVN